MESLNKLTFKTYKHNEKTLYIPMEDIVQEFDTKDYVKKYLFKVLYVKKQTRDKKYILYLAPHINSKINIVRAELPFEVIRYKKIIPCYDYKRELDSREWFIINERTYREISKINKSCYRSTYGAKRTKDYYILVYGYLINSYKNDNALTKVEYGIQEFGLTSRVTKSFSERGYESNCFVTPKWELVCKNLGVNIPKPEFKSLPKNFFEE